MISIQKELKNKKWKSKMLLQVHDELVFDVHKTELDALKIMVKTKMENAFIIDVPLVVDVGVGNNWLEAH
jgi:DNA polymerase-1